MWLLDACGYVQGGEGVDAVNTAQPAQAITCLWALMTMIPAAVALLSMIIVWLYPLTTARMTAIVAELKTTRHGAAAVEAAAETAAEADNVND